MTKKIINGIKLSEIKSKKEKLWFSAIKQIARETNFGQVELILIVRNCEITGISETKIKKRWNTAGGY